MGGINGFTFEMSFQEAIFVTYPSMYVADARSIVSPYIILDIFLRRFAFPPVFSNLYGFFVILNVWKKNSYSRKSTIFSITVEFF
jgi:hypothetical protein